MYMSIFVLVGNYQIINLCLWMAGYLLMYLSFYGMWMLTLITCRILIMTYDQNCFEIEMCDSKWVWLLQLVFKICECCWYWFFWLWCIIRFHKDGREFTFDKPVEGAQAVEIFDPVKLLPKSVVLPWQSSGRNVRFNFMVGILIFSSVKFVVSFM